MKTLVNHSGIIQYKYIISSHEQLLKYAELFNLQISNSVSHILSDVYKEKDLSQMKYGNNHTKALASFLMAGRQKKKGLMHASSDLFMNKIMAMEKLICEGKTLVVNQGGGYCDWDNDCMQLVDETQYKHLSENSAMLEPKIKINNSPVLVLENQSLAKSASLLRFAQLSPISPRGGDFVLFCLSASQTSQSYGLFP